jgi:hypothetical protein
METTVTPVVIERWLGDSPCVLLIDELNNLECLALHGNNDASLCFGFLKSNFLSKENRYMVFSSHVVTTTIQLSSFMESASSQRVEIRALPLIPTLSVAVENFDWADLNARQLLYCGNVPALVYTGWAKGNECKIPRACPPCNSKERRGSQGMPEE